MKIKKGDTVIMRGGKDRGKQGKVVAVDPKAMRVTVERLNLITKHQKPRRAGEKGQRISVPRAVPASSIMFICPQCGKRTRVGMKILEDGKKNRRCVRCQATFV